MAAIVPMPPQRPDPLTRRPSRPQLEALIRETGGNVSLLADRLGCSRQTLYTWVYQLGLADVVGIRPAEAAGAVLPAMPERVTATVKVEAKLWKKIRVRAVEGDTSVSSLVEAALRAFLGGEP